MKKKRSRSKVKGLSQFMREARIKSGLTQMEVAKHLGHSTAQYISNLERGLFEPSIEMSIKLCALFGIPRDKLYRVMLSLYKKSIKEKLGV